MRERDVLNAIRSALIATNAFDDQGVFLWGFNNAADEGADKTRAVAIIPLDGAEEDLYDDVLAGQMFETDRCKLVILVRDGDDRQRDEDADRLLNVCKDALNGNALNAVMGAQNLYPQWTKILRWSRKEPTPPQREIEAIFQFRFDAPTWVSFDTSE